VRAVVTRVSQASVTVDGQVVGTIGPGLLALVGAGRDDDADRARALARKVHELRVFPTEGGARSIGDLGLPVLVVSQFTLYADTRKGRRPSWSEAAPGEMAQPLVDEWSPSSAAAAAPWPPVSSGLACRWRRSTRAR
jgi:D-tyrosyl-tRNA(Tyr) deacylase